MLPREAQASPAPSVIVCERTPPRLAYVRDPSGRSLLNGYGTLTEQRRWGDAVTGYVVAFASGVTAEVPPAWVTFPQPQDESLLIPFPPRRA